MKAKVYVMAYLAAAFVLLFAFSMSIGLAAKKATASNASPSVALVPEGFSGWANIDGSLKYFKEGSLVTDDWVGDIYINADGEQAVECFIEHDGNTFYIDKSGLCKKGRFYVGDKEYCTNADGVLLSNTWYLIDESWIFVSEDGSVLKAAQTPDGYMVDPDGILTDSDQYASYEGFTYSLKELRLNTGAGKIIWDYLKKKGWTDTAIAGVLGNFQQESHLSPGWEEKGGDGFGLGQWSFSRRDGLEAYAKGLGSAVNDIYVQLDYMMIEPRESNFVKIYSKTNYDSAGDACVAWCKGWERPNMKKARLSDVRIPYAMAYYAHFVNGTNFLTEAYNYEEPKYADEESDEANAYSTGETAESSENTESTNVNNLGTLGWIYDTNGWKYKLPGGVFAKSEWKKISGEWYWFGEDEYMESGKWITDDAGGNYKLDSEGHIIPVDSEGNELQESLDASEANIAAATSSNAN